VRRKDNPEPPLASSTAERLAAIVEAAERAAVTVIDDAEAQARRRLAEAQAEADRLVGDRLAELAELTDSLVAQAEAIRGQSERLIFSLREAKRRLGVEEPEGEGPQASARSSHLSAVEPAVAPVEQPTAAAPTTLRPGGGEGSAAGARLLATQMAVSGSSREEIAARLRNGFEIEDTASILDAILGPEE
jgi:vacuolar-type H+-ATPase subunit H